MSVIENIQKTKENISSNISTIKGNINSSVLKIKNKGNQTLSTLKEEYQLTKFQENLEPTKIKNLLNNPKDVNKYQIISLIFLIILLRKSQQIIKLSVVALIALLAYSHFN
jgi:hypothetical protein